MAVHFNAPTIPGAVTKPGWSGCGKDLSRTDIEFTVELDAVTCKHSGCLSAVAHHRWHREQVAQAAALQHHGSVQMAAIGFGPVLTPTGKDAIDVPGMGWLNEDRVRDLRNALGSALKTLSARRKM